MSLNSLSGPLLSIYMCLVYALFGKHNYASMNSQGSTSSTVTNATVCNCHKVIGVFVLISISPPKTTILLTVMFIRSNSTPCQACSRLILTGYYACTLCAHTAVIAQLI